MAPLPPLIVSEVMFLSTSMLPKVEVLMTVATLTEGEKPTPPTMVRLLIVMLRPTIGISVPEFGASKVPP